MTAEAAGRAPVTRAAAAGDAGAIAATYAPVVRATAISFQEKAPGPAGISRRMLAGPRLPWLVAEDGGQIAGYACASAHRQRPAYRWPADCSIYPGDRYKRGAWRDVGWWQRALGGPPAAPEEPRAWHPAGHVTP